MPKKSLHFHYIGEDFEEEKKEDAQDSSDGDSYAVAMEEDD